MSEGLISLDELDVVAEKFTAQLCDVMMQVIGRPLELSSIITQGKKKHRRNRKRPTYQQIIKDFHRFRGVSMKLFNMSKHLDAYTEIRARRQTLELEEEEEAHQCTREMDAYPTLLELIKLNMANDNDMDAADVNIDVNINANPNANPNASTSKKGTASMFSLATGGPAPAPPLLPFNTFPLQQKRTAITHERKDELAATATASASPSPASSPPPLLPSPSPSPSPSLSLLPSPLSQNGCMCKCNCGAAHSVSPPSSISTTTSSVSSEPFMSLTAEERKLPPTNEPLAVLSDMEMAQKLDRQTHGERMPRSNAVVKTSTDNRQGEEKDKNRGDNNDNDNNDNSEDNKNKTSDADSVAGDEEKKGASEDTTSMLPRFQRFRNLMYKKSLEQSNRAQEEEALSGVQHGNVHNDDISLERFQLPRAAKTAADNGCLHDSRTSDVNHTGATGMATTKNTTPASSTSNNNNNDDNNTEFLSASQRIRDRKGAETQPLSSPLSTLLHTPLPSAPTPSPTAQAAEALPLYSALMMSPQQKAELVYIIGLPTGPERVTCIVNFLVRLDPHTRNSVLEKMPAQDRAVIRHRLTQPSLADQAYSLRRLAGAPTVGVVGKSDWSKLADRRNLVLKWASFSEARNKMTEYMNKQFELSAASSSKHKSKSTRKPKDAQKDNKKRKSNINNDRTPSSSNGLSCMDISDEQASGGDRSYRSSSSSSSKNSNNNNSNSNSSHVRESRFPSHSSDTDNPAYASSFKSQLLSPSHRKRSSKKSKRFDGQRDTTARNKDNAVERRGKGPHSKNKKKRKRDREGKSAFPSGAILRWEVVGISSSHRKIRLRLLDDDVRGPNDEKYDE